MNSHNLILSQLMQHKKWVDMSLYALLQTPAYKNNVDLSNKALYWLNHIHIVDQIFKSHMQGELCYFTSTVSSTFPPLQELHQAAEELDQWLIEYACTLDEDSANEMINFTFTDGDKGCMSRTQMLMHLSSHGLYHIGVTAQELANQGLPIPQLLFTSFLSKTTKPTTKP